MPTPSTYRADEPLVTLLQRCRLLRRTATSAEALPWSLLRGRQLAGAKFRRQHQFGLYVLDFYCAEHQLAIEVDGETNGEPDRLALDVVRTGYLASHGIRELRFTNREALHETAAVIEAIWRVVAADPHPTPLPGGEGIMRRQ